jgi:hypothetical protein
MALDLQTERQQAHSLIDLLPPEQLVAVRSLLAVMVDVENEEEGLTAQDIRALRASDERLRNGGETIPFEQVVEDLGFTMEQVRSGSLLNQP